MTGAEHYREAERLLDLADENGRRANNDAVEAITLGYAQVHATLALAAATALQDNGAGMTSEDAAAWTEVTGA